jgi:hypothetical protein
MDHTTAGSLATSILYMCESAKLPSSLPTIKEIKSTALNLPSIRDLRFGGVVRIREQFVVKYGRHVDENDGYALLFLEKHPNICSPRLYAMLRQGQEILLIMSFEPGKQLSDIWNDLTENDKLSLSDQLRGIWDYMRAIPSPGIFGSVQGGPVPHHYFWLPDPELTISGPFDTEERFSLASVSSLVRIGRIPNDDPGCRNFSNDISQLHSKDTVVYLHMEIYNVRKWDDNWLKKVERILDAWPLEAALLRVVRQDLEY